MTSCIPAAASRSRTSSRRAMGREGLWKGIGVDSITRGHGVVADDAHHFLDQVIFDVDIVAPPRDGDDQRFAFWCAGEAEGFQGFPRFRRVYVHAEGLAEAAQGEGYGERGAGSG